MKRLSRTMGAVLVVAAFLVVGAAPSFAEDYAVGLQGASCITVTNGWVQPFVATVVRSSDDAYAVAVTASPDPSADWPVFYASGYVDGDTAAVEATGPPWGGYPVPAGTRTLWLTLRSSVYPTGSYAAMEVPVCGAGAYQAQLTTKTQAMDGNLMVPQGSTLYAGFDFTMPGRHPTAMVSFSGTQVTFNAACASGTPGSMTITLKLPYPYYQAPYEDLMDSPAWLPSGNQKDLSTYQLSGWVPPFCDPGALVRLQQGGTFRTAVTTWGTTADVQGSKVNVRWHYRGMSDTGQYLGSGGWSGTYSVTPS